VIERSLRDTSKQHSRKSAGAPRPDDEHIRPGRGNGRKQLGQRLTGADTRSNLPASPTELRGRLLDVPFGLREAFSVQRGDFPPEVIANAPRQEPGRPQT
jgi:hypothetical protein